MRYLRESVSSVFLMQWDEGNGRVDGSVDGERERMPLEELAVARAPRSAHRQRQKSKRTPSWMRRWPSPCGAPSPAPVSPRKAMISVLEDRSTASCWTYRLA